MGFLEFIEQYKSLFIEIGKAAVIAIAAILVYKIFSRKKEREVKEVKKQAYTDQLTSRGNRYLFYKDLDFLLEEKKKFAVCFMDLDGFKQINDTLGHDAGDELLITLANIFDDTLPSYANSYRLGGDEFAIIIKDIEDKEDVKKVLDALKHQISIPVIIDGNNTISIEYSLGVVMSLDSSMSRKDLINYADNAMYYIKEHGGNDYYFHNDSLKAQLENNAKMERDLKNAYDNNEFGISLQPRINVDDTATIGFEALIHWNHPILGKLEAAYFIKQAEDMGLTLKLDKYVLRTVCEKLMYFKDKGYTNVHVCVNISNKNAFKKEFIDTICTIISSYELPEKSLQIEMTGNIEKDKVEEYKVMFERLKELGVGIIINNFEIKHESLELFRDLPIDEVKINSAIVADSRFNPEVFTNIIQLIKNLGYKVVIGRVSDDKKLIRAISDGAEKIQGDFLFKKMDELLAEEVLNNYGAYRLRIEEIIVNAKKTI